MDREAWQATVHSVARVRDNLVTKQQQSLFTISDISYPGISSLLFVKPVSIPSWKIYIF